MEDAQLMTDKADLAKMVVTIFRSPRAESGVTKGEVAAAEVISCQDTYTVLKQKLFTAPVLIQ